jgi:hypothetical protein
MLAVEQRQAAERARLLKGRAGGPARGVTFSVTVADTGMDNQKSEPGKYFFEKTFAATDTVEQVREAARSHLAGLGWKSLLFQSVILVGPLKIPGDGSSERCRMYGAERQISVLGSMRGFRVRRAGRKVCLSGLKTLAEVLETLEGNALRVSALPGPEAFAAAVEADRVEVADNLQREEARRMRREERRRKKAERQAERARKEALEAKRRALEETGDVYNWGGAPKTASEDVIPAEGHAVEVLRDVPHPPRPPVEEVQTLMLE